MLIIFPPNDMIAHKSEGKLNNFNYCVIVYTRFDEIYNLMDQLIELTKIAHFT